MPKTRTTSTAAAKTTSTKPHVVTIEVKVRLQALAVQEADGGYCVTVPPIPGCVTEGDTLEEAEANAIEAAELMLEVAHDANKGEALSRLTE